MSDNRFKDLDAEETRLRERLAELERLRARRAQVLKDAAEVGLKLMPDDDGSTATTAQPQPSPSASNVPPPPIETMGALIDDYLDNPASTFRNLRFSTRMGYQRNIKRIVADLGHEKIRELTAKKIQTYYDRWSKGGKKLALSHALITMLRIIVGYGANTLELQDCRLLATTLHGMMFSPPKPRKEQLTIVHVVGIIRRAREMKRPRPSIALAQAIQFECGLRQKEVIGEYLPMDDPEPSSIFSPDNTMKWVRGLRWSDINGTTLTYGGRTFDLTKCPLTTTELDRFPDHERDGPLIKNEKTGKPYEGWQFRRIWRDIADEAGVPKKVWNTDVLTQAKARRFRATEGDASVAR